MFFGVLAFAFAMLILTFAALIGVAFGPIVFGRPHKFPPLPERSHRRRPF